MENQQGMGAMEKLTNTFQVIMYKHKCQDLNLKDNVQKQKLLTT